MAIISNHFTYLGTIYRQYNIHFVMIVMNFIVVLGSFHIDDRADGTRPECVISLKHRRRTLHRKNVRQFARKSISYYISSFALYIIHRVFKKHYTGY